MLQDRIDAGVRDATGGQRPMAGRGETFGSVALEQPLETHARAIAVLWMRPRVENPLHQLANRRPDAPSPGDQLRRRPLQVRSVRRWHVLGLGEEAPLAVLACMAGHAPTAMEDLDGRRGRAYVDVLAHQAVWDRVEARIELDVVINVDGSSRLPNRKLVGRRWQWLQCRAFELVEELASGAGLAAKRPIIDQPDLLGDGDVELGERKELAPAQWGEDASFGDEHTSLDGGLNPGPIRPAGSHRNR